MSGDLRLGIVGFGKIAQDEHVPAIAHTPGVTLAAVASRHGRAEGLPGFATIEEMLAAEPDLDAVVMCQPPAVRFEAARAALLAGKHVFLEKPPGITLSEIDVLRDLAARAGVTLYASWHSRHGMPVAALRDWCAGRVLRRIAIEWKEDVRRWHPGQQWIWEPGGFGVLDPGINALSVLTEVVPERVRLVDATLSVPANRATPIAADLALETASGVPVAVAFDWRQTGPQTWQITFEAEDETYVFDAGASEATADGVSPIAFEYRAMYRRFVDLVRNGTSDVDIAPFQLVADVWMCGRVNTVEPFDD